MITKMRMKVGFGSGIASKMDVFVLLSRANSRGLILETQTRITIRSLAIAIAFGPTS